MAPASFSITLDDLPVPSVVTTPSGVITRTNTAFDRLTEVPSGMQRPTSINEVLTPASRMFLQTHVFPLLYRGELVDGIACQFLLPSGKRVPMYINAAQRSGQHDADIVWILFGGEERQRFEKALIDARKQAQTQASELQAAHERLSVLNSMLETQVQQTEAANRSLAEQALKDGLTQLGNRRSLQNLQNAAMGLRDYALMMIDIDHFKAVNDTYGHDRGDQVLIDVAHCIRRIARAGDHAIRYGGEEFVLVLSRAEVQGAVTVAKRLHDAIKDARPGGLEVTVSIGVAASCSTTSDLFKTLKLADDALYQAKRDGRNCTRVL